jgi:hypothetical protein
MDLRTCGYLRKNAGLTREGQQCQTAQRPVMAFTSEMCESGAPWKEGAARAASYLRLERVFTAGQRARTEVERPPRGVNSPRTTHHSGWMAATMSRSILLTAFS